MPTTISTAAILWFDHSAAGLSIKLRKYAPDFFVYRARREVVPPWRPFPSVISNNTTYLPFPATVVSLILVTFAKTFQYTLERQDTLTILSKAIGANYAVMWVLSEEIGLGTSLTVYSDIVVEGEYEDQDMETLESERIALAQRQVDELMRFLHSRLRA